MSLINNLFNRSTNVGTPGAANTGATGNAGATTGTANTTATTATSTTPPVDVSNAGNPNLTGVSAPIARAVSGLPAGFDVKNLITSAWMRDTDIAEGMTGSYIARPTSSSFVGYGDITGVKATNDGFQVDVAVYTNKQDNVALFLQVPILDKKTGSLTLLNLDLLTHDRGSGSFVENIPSAQVKDPVSGQQVWGGLRSYQFSLSQINDFIKKAGLDVVVKPGDRMAVTGMVEKDGHRLMNGAVNTFEVPKPRAAQVGAGRGALATRVGNMTGQTAIKAEDMPLDMSVKLSQKILDTSLTIGGRYLKVGDILEGDITTRLESEYKGSVNAGQMNQMITRSYALAELSERALGGDAAARKQLDKELGKDLVLTPVKRHWMCSDGKPLGERDPNNLGVDAHGAPITVTKDAQGWPHLDPMQDGYSDTKNLDFSQHSAVARERGNAQKAGHAEFKLSGGVLDATTGIRQRVETGMSLKAGATGEQLRELFKWLADTNNQRQANWHELNDSPLGHVVKQAKEAGVLDALISNDRTKWADVHQIRHKFELKNTATGTSAELSLDMVNAKTVRPEHMRNGQPIEETYYVIEAELDHLQINSANVSEVQEAKNKNALTNTTAQEQWLTTTADAQKKGDVELEVLSKPQLHTEQQVKDGTARHTASYKDYEKMQDKLLGAICDGFLPGPARQKASHFAELAGLIGPENTVTT
jgi:hypothetical protein